MCGGLALISDVGYIMVTRAFEDEHPYAGWVNGRSCMILVALLVLYPLCLQRHMREVRVTPWLLLMIAIDHAVYIPA